MSCLKDGMVYGSNASGTSVAPYRKSEKHVWLNKSIKNF